MVRIRHMRRVEAASWYRLPAEIQAMVLAEIVAEADATLKVDQASVSAKLNQGIGRLASVCRDWQGFFERRTFKRLLLIESNLSGFEQVILSRPVRLTYIQNLLLRIKLSVYNCKACEQPEDASTIKLNNAIFSSCIQHLLNTLASWNPEPCNSAKPGFHGLTLEIFVYSPSDNNHRFNFCAQENDYPFRTAADLGKTPSLLEYHRQRAALGPTTQQKKHESGTLFLYRDAKRLYGTPLKLASTAPVLPRAPIVKGLLLRRSTCRSIDVGALAQILRQSLVALTWFRYESRRPVCYPEVEDFAEGFRKTLVPALPSSLRRLHLNETLDFSTYEKLAGLPLDADDLALAICTNPSLGQLREFSAGYQVTAREVLSELGQRRRLLTATIPLPRCRWENLELLCLASYTLASPWSSKSAIERVMYDGAQAALKLPKLRIMEVWGSSSQGFAHLFRYKLEHREATITWKWCEGRPVELPRKYGKHWRKVVFDRGGRLPVRVVQSRFPESTAEIRDSQGQCILKHLELKHLYLDPITLAQIEADEAIRSGSLN